MADPRTPDPRRPGDPLYSETVHGGSNSPYSDPAADPRIGNQTVVHSRGGRRGIIIAGVVAALLVVALIAFTTGPSTDPGTTAVIPDQSGETIPPTDTAPAPEAAPSAPATPLDTPSAPATDAPAGEAPTPNQ